MAYNTKYLNIYETLEGYTIRVQIEEEDYSGGATAMTLDGTSPVLITRTLKGNVLTSGCKLNVINDLPDLYEYANIHKEDERTYLLSIIRTYQGVDSTLLFKGYLIDDVFNQKLEKGGSLTLAFNDGLAHIERYYPAFLTGVDTYVLEQEVIEQCIAFTYLDGNIMVNSTLYEDDMSSAEKADNPLLASYINKMSFIKSDGDFENADEILKKILQSYHAILYQKGGHYYVERNIDRIKTSKTWWRYTPGQSNPYDSYVESGLSPTSLDAYILHRDSLNYTLIPAVKLLKVQLKYEYFENMIINDWTNINPIPYVTGTWALYYPMVIADDSWSNNFITRGVRLTKEAAATWQEFEDDADLMWNGVFTKDSNDETIIDYSYKFYKGATAHSLYFTFRFRMRLEDGVTTKWLRNDPVNEGEFILDDNPWTVVVDISTGEYGEWPKEFNPSWAIDLTNKLSAFGGEITFTIFNRPVLLDGDVLETLCWYGDFEFKTNKEDLPNLVLNDLNINKNKEIEESLALFDTLNWNYINNKYRKYSVWARLCKSWTDETLTSLTLQDHYITNRCQFLNHVRNSFKLRIQKVKISIDEIFTTTVLQDENANDIKLVVETMTHNPKADTYDIKFIEYISDVNKRIGLTP